MISHCRGGIGRAGLLAACVLLATGSEKTSQEAILKVRKIRDKRCVESRKQEEFIKKYRDFLQLADHDSR